MLLNASKLVAAAAIAASVSLVHADPLDPSLTSGNMQLVTSHTLEGYVPDAPDAVAISSIEMRASAVISGGNGEVTLRQICRWAEADNDKFAAVADLVVMRLGSGGAFGTIDVEQIQQALSDAGVAAGAINFGGAMRCTVSRTDVKVDEGEALRQWVANATIQQQPQPQSLQKPTSASAVLPPQESRRVQFAPLTVASATSTPMLDATPSVTPEQSPGAVLPTLPPGVAVAVPVPVADSAPLARAAPIAAPIAASAPTPTATGDLRAMLISDVAARTHLPVTRLQIDFSAGDRALLSLAAPVKFTIEPQRYGDLGETSWIVTLTVGTAEPRKVRVRATARGWIDQVLAKRNIGTHEAIAAGDVEVKPTLADRLTPDLVASADAVVGKQAAHELRVGTVLTERMIAPLEMVKSGQAITVTMRRGSIQIRSVATSMQSGSLNQVVRVRNPTTNEIYEVQLTGPQVGVVPGSDPVVADARN